MLTACKVKNEEGYKRPTHYILSVRRRRAGWRGRQPPASTGERPGGGTNDGATRANRVRLSPRYPMAGRAHTSHATSSARSGLPQV